MTEAEQQRLRAEQADQFRRQYYEECLKVRQGPPPQWSVTVRAPNSDPEPERSPPPRREPQQIDIWTGDEMIQVRPGIWRPKSQWGY